MVGNVAVLGSGGSNDGTLLFESEEAIQPMRRLAEAISALGSLPGIQLACAPPGLAPARNWVTKDVVAEQHRLSALLTALSDQSLRRVTGAFLRSIRLAVVAGFDVIQLHCAHGYLLSLLTNPLVNRRTGEFSCEGQWFAHFVQDAISLARESVLSIRFSLFSGIASDSASEIAFTSQLSGQAAALGVGILDYSAGFYSIDKRLIYPGVEKGVLPYLSIVRPLAERLPAVLTIAGNVLDIRELPGLPANMAVSVGRALIADPDFAAKSSGGAHAEIHRCARRGHCHYFSRGRPGLQCGTNPDIGLITV